MKHHPIRGTALSLVMGIGLGLTSGAHAALNWTAMNGPGGGQITSFEFIDSNTIWASSHEGFVYRSTDGGNSWVDVSGLKGADIIGNRLTLFVDSNGKYYAHIGKTLFSSNDGGTSWTSIATDINGIYLDGNDTLYKSDIALDTSAFQYVATVSSSTDGGNSWTQLGELARNVTAAATTITQDGAGNFYALIPNIDIYRSSDNGATWTAISDLTNTPTALAADSQGNLFAGANGLFVSSDNGATWTEKSEVTDRITHFAFSNNAIFASTSRQVLSGSARYWTSTDGGGSWSATSLTQTDTLIHLLEAAPNGDLYLNSYPRYNHPIFDQANVGGGRVQKIPAGGSAVYIDLDSGLGHASVDNILEAGDNLIATAEYGNLWLSSDGGTSWSVPASAPVVGVNAIGKQDNMLYLSAFSGFYSSNDNGATWSQLTGDTGHYSEFASDNNGRLYLWGEAGFRYSDDGGVSWIDATTGCSGRSSSDENALAVSGDGQNLYVNECYSNDGGNSWAKASFPSGSTNVIHSLVLDSNGGVLAGKNAGGVEKSTDGGATYQRSNGGMDAYNTNPGGLSTLMKDNSNNFYALAPYGVGAYLSGVWSSSDGGANWVRENSGLPVTVPYGEFGALDITQRSSGDLIVSLAGSGLYTTAGGGGSGGTDTTAPVVTVPTKISVAAESANGTPASNATIAAFLTGASAVDDVDGPLGVTHDAPTTFPAGTTTTVTFSATDAAGNTGTATATVTVGTYSSGGTSGGSSGGTTSGGGGAINLWLLLLIAATGRWIGRR